MRILKRKVITFTTKDKGFELKNKSMNGTCILNFLENECKLSISINNIEKNTYQIYLIYSKTAKSKNIGSVTSDNGILEFKYTVDKDDFDFNVIALTHIESNNILYPMVAFLEDEVFWDNSILTQTNLYKEKKIEKITEVAIETTPIKIPTDNEVEEDTMYKFYKLDSDDTKDISYVFSNNEKISPFEKQKKEVHWVSITKDELGLLPKQYHKLAESLFVTDKYTKYNHLILGYTINNTDELFLGIPDIYKRVDDYLGREAGFLQFKPCLDKRHFENEKGYWLINIAV